MRLLAPCNSTRAASRGVFGLGSEAWRSVRTDKSWPSAARMACAWKMWLRVPFGTPIGATRIRRFGAWCSVRTGEPLTSVHDHWNGAISIRLWDVETDALLHTLEGHSDHRQAMEQGDTDKVVVFSPDGQTLASGTYDLTMSLSDLETGDLRHTLKGHTGLVWRLAFNPDGQTVASAAHDRTGRLWDAETGALLHTLWGHRGMVRSVAFSPDARILASGDGSGHCASMGSGNRQPGSMQHHGRPYRCGSQRGVPSRWAVPGQHR